MKTLGLFVNGTTFGTTIKSQDKLDLIVDDLRHGDSENFEMVSDVTEAVILIKRSRIDGFWTSPYRPKPDRHAEQSDKIISLVEKALSGGDEWKE